MSEISRIQQGTPPEKEDYTDEDEEILDRLVTVLEDANVVRVGVAGQMVVSLRRLQHAHERNLNEATEFEEKLDVTERELDLIRGDPGHLAREAVTEAWTAMHPHDPALEWTRTTEEPWATIARALS